MRTSLLFAFLFFLYSCNFPIVPETELSNPESESPTIPLLGQQITVAYVHLKSMSYNDVYQTDIREQLRDLLDRYDVLYTYIEAGEGLRYWDFGLIKLENNIPIKNWTTGDYHLTRKWNYISHREELFEDSSAFDYNFPQHGYDTQFTKTPFGMHYYSSIDSRVRLNVLGANINHNRYDQEMESLNHLLTNLSYWGHKKTIAFGNFTKDCQNKLEGLILDENTCPEQSVWISPELKNNVESVEVLNPGSAGVELISDHPVIEVILNI